MWNTNTENLGLRTEPQLKINSQREILEVQSDTENLGLRTEPQLKINSQRILEVQSETQQNVDSVMTVQDAIKQDERVDMLVRMRWTIERLYDNITKGEPMANSIDYMFFMIDYDKIKQNDLEKLELEIWKDFFLDFRKAYLSEKILKSLRSSISEAKKYLTAEDYIAEFKDLEIDLNYILNKCKTEEEKRLLLSFFER